MEKLLFLMYFHHYTKKRAKNQSWKRFIFGRRFRGRRFFPE